MLRPIDEANERLHVGHGVLRLVDLVVLTMDDDGSLTRVEIAYEDFGDLLIADSQFAPGRCVRHVRGPWCPMCSRANEPAAKERADAVARARELGLIRHVA